MVFHSGYITRLQQDRTGLKLTLSTWVSILLASPSFHFVPLPMSDLAILLRAGLEITAAEHTLSKICNRTKEKKKLAENRVTIGKIQCA